MNFENQCLGENILFHHINFIELSNYVRYLKLPIFLRIDPKDRFTIDNRPSLIVHNYIPIVTAVR